MATKSNSAVTGVDSELRRRIAELEVENEELRRAQRSPVELEASRAALQESKVRYRLVVESATDYAIFTMDLERRVTSWNAGAERVLGWKEGDILGRSADVIFTPEHRQAGVPAQEARSALVEGRADDNRWHLRRDGSRLWANGVMLPLRDATGASQGLLKILRDKTAEKRTTDELREKAGFLERVLESSADCIKVLDLEGRLEFLSAGGRAAMEIDDFGVFRGRPWVDFWNGSEAGQAALTALKAAQAGGTGRFQGAAPTAKGTLRRWDVQVTTIPGEDGRPERLLSISRDITGHTEAEAALRESEGRLRALADNLPSGMVYQVAMLRDGTERRFVYLAQSCERLTGIPAEAALAKPNALYELIAPEDRPGLAAAEAAAIRNLMPFEAEVRLVRADTGEIRSCRIASAPREVADGSLVWDGLLVDVTERRAAEEALREEAHSLEVLNRTGELLAAELDLSRVVQAVTDAATELSGAAFGAFFYLTAGENGEALTLYTLSGAPRSAFERFPLPRATAVFGPTLHGEGVVRSADITTDPRYGNNPPYRGMPEGHLPVRSYLAVPVTSRSGEVLGGLFLGHPDPGVFTGRSERLVTGVAAQAAIAIDNSRLFQAAQREVAARTAAEGELRLLNQTLEERVRERTRALEAEAAERERAEEQLRQAQKMEAVGQLTGGIAHDFNNLLTGIVGALGMLQRRIDAGRTEGLERYTGIAITSAQRAAALTQRLLAFARRQPLDPKPVDANRLVAGMEDLLRRTLGPAISLEMVLAGGLWPTLCDPNQLESAILNLAINARDAMPNGGRLTIETANAHLDDAYVRGQAGEVRPGQYVAVCVTDTGTGMSPDVVERAFEPFFTTKPIGQGTGLGLSMLYGFVKQSGGHVRIYSEPGQATTFKLYLPRHRGSLEAADATTQTKKTLGADTGETVLVVEDEPAVRVLVLETLRELGYTALEAADGPAGLRVLQSDVQIDLLVTDVGLPGLNGRQLADAARELRPELKVLFVTGYAHNAAIGNGLLDPGMEMITKPFALDALADKVRAMLDGT